LVARDGKRSVCHKFDFDAGRDTLREILFDSYFILQADSFEIALSPAEPGEVDRYMEVFLQRSEKLQMPCWTHDKNLDID